MVTPLEPRSWPSPPPRVERGKSSRLSSGSGVGWIAYPSALVTRSNIHLGFLSPRPAAPRSRVDAFDRAVDQVFDHLRGNRVADRVFYGASALGDHGLVWLILGALRGLQSDYDWSAAVRAGLGVGIESALVNLGVKSLFRRSRPRWEENRPRRLRRPRTSSFPSGHATAAFTAAGLLAEDDPLWPLYYTIALIVAWSRVYVRVHHASDVLGGIGIGFVLGLVGRRLRPLPGRRSRANPGTPLRALSPDRPHPGESDGRSGRWLLA